MKNFFKDNEYFKISLYGIFVIIISILFYRVSSNSDNIIPSIANFFKGILSILSPILYGLLIAYLFNPIMGYFEKWLLKWLSPKSVKQKKTVRTLSIGAVYLCIIGGLILVFRFMIPQIFNNIKELCTVLPSYMDQLQNGLNSMEKTVNDGLATMPYQFDTNTLFDMINPEKYINVSAITNIISKLMSQAVTLTSSLFNWIMGLVIAFYVLAQKESFSYSTKRAIYCLFKKQHADRIISIFSEGHYIFIQFFVGKFIDSFIIGAIAFVGFTLMKNDYAVLLALIVGVTNMIPYFGPLLGAIPAVIITLFTGFMPAIFVGIFIFILQQFDGLVLGPKILGDSIGLSPFWIISGILVGGALWGPLGMFFASPIIAVLLANLNRIMDRILKNKEIEIPALPKDPPKPKHPSSKNPTNWFKKLTQKNS